MFRKISLNILLISTTILLGYNIFVIEDESQRRELKLEQEEETRDEITRKITTNFITYLTDSTTKYNNSNLSLSIIHEGMMFSRNYEFEIMNKGEYTRNEIIPTDSEFVKLSVFLDKIISKSNLTTHIASYNLAYLGPNLFLPSVRFSIVNNKIVKE